MNGHEADCFCVLCLPHPQEIHVTVMPPMTMEEVNNYLNQQERYDATDDQQGPVECEAVYITGREDDGDIV